MTHTIYTLNINEEGIDIALHVKGNPEKKLIKFIPIASSLFDSVKTVEEEIQPNDLETILIVKHKGNRKPFREILLDLLKEFPEQPQENKN